MKAVMDVAVSAAIEKSGISADQRTKINTDSSAPSTMMNDFYNRVWDLFDIDFESGEYSIKAEKQDDVVDAFTDDDNNLQQDQDQLTEISDRLEKADQNPVAGTEKI